MKNNTPFPFCLLLLISLFSFPALLMKGLPVLAAETSVREIDSFLGYEWGTPRAAVEADLAPGSFSVDEGDFTMPDGEDETLVYCEVSDPKGTYYFAGSSDELDAGDLYVSAAETETILSSLKQWYGPPFRSNFSLMDAIVKALWMDDSGVILFAQMEESDRTQKDQYLYAFRKNGVFDNGLSSEFSEETGIDFWSYLKGESELSPEYAYIFANSDARELGEDDIRGCSLQLLSYARNEIYARHGRKFASLELQEYFSEKAWYEGTIEPADFDLDVLSDVEKENAAFLEEAELSGSAGYLLDRPAHSIDLVNEYLFSRMKSYIPDEEEPSPDETTPGEEEMTTEEEQEEKASVPADLLEEYRAFFAAIQSQDWYQDDIFYYQDPCALLTDIDADAVPEILLKDTGGRPEVFAFNEITGHLALAGSLPYEEERSLFVNQNEGALVYGKEDSYAVSRYDFYPLRSGQLQETFSVTFENVHTGTQPNGDYVYEPKALLLKGGIETGISVDVYENYVGKLAGLSFVKVQEIADRLAQMGEQPPSSDEDPYDTFLSSFGYVSLEPLSFKKLQGYDREDFGQEGLVGRMTEDFNGDFVPECAVLRVAPQGEYHELLLEVYVSRRQVISQSASVSLGLLDDYGKNLDLRLMALRGPEGKLRLVYQQILERSETSVTIYFFRVDEEGQLIQELCLCDGGYASGFSLYEDRQEAVAGSELADIDPDSLIFKTGSRLEGAASQFAAALEEILEGQGLELAHEETFYGKEAYMLKQNESITLIGSVGAEFSYNASDAAYSYQFFGSRPDEAEEYKE